MKTSHSFRRLALLVGLAAVAAFVLSSCQQEKPATPESKAADPKAIHKVFTVSQEGQQYRMLIDKGSEGGANVYAARIQTNLGIATDATLDYVLEFCGYAGLSGHDIEITPSAQLMERFPGDIVSSSFFAPKIIDVSDNGCSTPGCANTKDIGWRKVVRLRAKDGSTARTKGLSAMFLLFNVFQKRDINEIAKDPFEPCRQATPTNCSKNNQVMLIVGNPQPGQDAAYWFVFENAEIGGGKRTNNLPASFDFARTNTSDLIPYYLPAACAECHGGSPERAKLNFLDTDHWNDRIQDGDDFPDFRTNTQHGVLFDGGRDITSTTFKAAFAAVKTLNTEIRDQNQAVGTVDGKDFQFRAADNWRRLHETNLNFLPPIERAFPAPTSNPNARVWNANDKEFLQLLNQFCYRCHSSVKFNVFDKEAMANPQGQVRGLLAPYVSSGFMPQDRKLNTPALQPKKEALLQYINALQ